MTDSLLDVVREI